jgi:hypothetical protein
VRIAATTVQDTDLRDDRLLIFGVLNTFHSQTIIASGRGHTARAKHGPKGSRSTVVLRNLVLGGRPLEGCTSSSRRGTDRPDRGH